MAAAVWALRRFIRPGEEPRNHENAPCLFWGLMVLGLAVRIIVGRHHHRVSQRHRPAGRAGLTTPPPTACSGLYVRGGFSATTPPGTCTCSGSSGKVRMLLGIPSDSALFLVMVKLPSILADLATEIRAVPNGVQALGQRRRRGAGRACTFLTPRPSPTPPPGGRSTRCWRSLVLLFVWLLFERKIVLRLAGLCAGACSSSPDAALRSGAAGRIRSLHPLEDGWKKALKVFGISLAAGAAGGRRGGASFHPGKAPHVDCGYLYRHHGYYQYASLTRLQLIWTHGRALWSPIPARGGA
jgi:hypothetical protein